MYVCPFTGVVTVLHAYATDTPHVYIVRNGETIVLTNYTHLWEI